MRFSVNSTLHRVLSVAIYTVSLSFLSGNDMYANGSIAFGQNSQSVAATGGRVSVDLVFNSPIGLAGLQFKITGVSEGIRFTDVERGEVVVDAAVWSLHYSISRGGDTLIAVLWSRNGSSLPEGTYNGLLTIGVGAGSRLGMTSPIVLNDVQSVLGDGLGNTANIAIGSPSSVNIHVEEAQVTQKKPELLSQNYPNPCNPSTLIRYIVPEQGHVTLKVYDVMGQEVRTVIDGTVGAGEFEAVLSMDGLPSGMYFYRFSGSGFEHIRKMLLLK